VHMLVRPFDEDHRRVARGDYRTPKGEKKRRGNNNLGKSLVSANGFSGHSASFILSLTDKAWPWGTLEKDDLKEKKKRARQMQESCPASVSNPDGRIDQTGHTRELGSLHRRQGRQVYSAREES